MLKRWEAERAANPNLTTLQHSMMMGMRHEVYLARMAEARRMRERKMQAIPAVQAGAITSIDFDAPPGWSQWFLFQSDNHHDSPLCNRELEAEHLQEAVKRDAMIMVMGDLFDAMQGRFDPRRSMEELRPEYRRSDYYDAIVNDTCQFL